MRREPTNRWAVPEKRSHSAHRGKHKSRMEKLSRELRANNPFCQVCCKRPSTEVHHKRKWSDDVASRIDPRNLLCVCRECHELIEKVNGRP